MWKYNGKGFIVGIPARDLTDEEAKQYGITHKRNFGLYKKVKPVSDDDDKGVNKWQGLKHYERSS